MCVVDRLTKMVILIPTTSTSNSEDVARLYRDHVFSQFGVPTNVVSDRGPTFASEFMKAFLKLIGSEARLSSAYHPETNGQTERLNREVATYLRAWTDREQKDWKEWLKIAQFAINNRPAQSTGVSPFMLNYGRHPRTLPNKNIGSSTNESANQFATRMTAAWKAAKESLEVAAELMKKQVDKKRGPANVYQPGDKVWLETTNLNLREPSKKLSDKRVGPFEVVKKVGEGAYKLRLPASWKALHSTFNEKLLTPFTPPFAAHQVKPPPPPPDIIDGHEEQEVEEIIDSQQDSAERVTYLVKWKGFDKTHDQWMGVQHLRNAMDAVHSFHQKYPAKPKAKGYHKWLDKTMPKKKKRRKRRSG